MTRLFGLVIIFAISGCNSEADSSSLAAALDQSAKPVIVPLGKVLKEVSGLDAAGPDRVFTHDDEVARIFEISLTDQATVRSFTIGDPALKGDFEGIAVSGDFIYMVTSNGLIYETRADSDRDANDYRIVNTGLGKICEIEGITIAPEGGLLLACKRSALSPKRDRLIIYRWSAEDREATREPWLNIPLRGMVPRPKKGSFSPSGLAVSAATGNLLVLDSNAAGLLEMTPEGKFVGFLALGTSRHRQAEGVAVLEDGSLVVADEGSKRKPAKLTVYLANQQSR